MLLPTIRSRARRVGFGGSPPSLIERTLRTRWDVEPEQAAELARLSGGRMGWAVVALHDERMMDQRDEALDRGRGDGVGAAERALRLGRRARRGLHAGPAARAGDARGVAGAGGGTSCSSPRAGSCRAVHSDRLDTLRPLAAQCDVRGAVRALRAIADARQQLDGEREPGAGAGGDDAGAAEAPAERCQRPARRRDRDERTRAHGRLRETIMTDHQRTPVGVRFKEAGKVYYFDAGEHALDVGNYVVVETSHGLEIGRVVDLARAGAGQRDQGIAEADRARGDAGGP